MSDLLIPLIDDIKKRVEADDPTAVERAVELAEQYSDKPEVWRLVAFAHSWNDDYDGAVLAVTRAMAVSLPEPADFINRGRYEFCRGNLQDALADFDQGIAISEQHNWGYYLSSLHFIRADVLVKLGRITEARAALAHVEDDHVDLTTEVRTKTDILADCKE